MQPKKYPRTPHLPFSAARTQDDISGASWAFLNGAEVVVTEKMDGENTTLYRDRYHARSIDSRYHESRSYISNMWAGISYLIPESRRIIVENVYAEHSIRYDDLPTYAFGIGVVDTVDGENVFLSWDGTVSALSEVGIQPAPLLYRGAANMDTLREIFEGLDTDRQEGIVVRSAAQFPESDFLRHVGKAVRAGHVQTDEHWTKNWRTNSLA